MTATTVSGPRLAVAAALVAAVLCGTLTACGSGNSGDTGSDSGHQSGSGSPADSSTVLSKEQVQNVLPDPGAMGGLDAVSARVITADGHLDCPSAQECPGKWFGHAKYALSEGAYVNFDLITYTSVQSAKEGMKREVGDNPPLSKPTFGNESRAYTKSGGGLQGEYITMRVGTVVATTFVEGGRSEPMLTQGTTMFAERIAQVEAGHKATATLPQE
ncbi:hypothetical protein [Streptomyces griseosporeus]|uniref:hypothetical protein n=1 Tax=Streptomyces griseosporeus TaxID=1910 RepID=UPI0036F6A16E